MRLPVEHRPVRQSRAVLALILAPALAACGLVAGAGSAVASGPQDAKGLGPEADYPVVVGDPYSVTGTTYKPEDVLNYDTVGYLAAEQGSERSVSGAHHTLPLPSYVEITSLDTGRTILVRLERRGPMNSNALVALSSAALAQLGGSQGTPVRVRRVNPPEDQRVLLRSGQLAPLRMDTPMSLVAILKRKLPAASKGAPAALAATPAPAPASPPASAAKPVPARTQPATNVEKPAAPRAAVAATSPVVHAAPAKGFVVQAGAYSSAESARRVAKAVGGAVSQAGKLWRVRTGPFGTRGAAEASLAKVRAAGYSEARIFPSG